MIDPSKYTAVDPMALMLSNKAYLIWIQIHHPHEPALSKIAELTRSLTQEEKVFALARAKTLVAYGRAMEQSLEGTISRT